MGVHYESIQPVDPTGTGSWRSLDILFSRVKDPPPASTSVEDLRKGFEDALATAQVICRDEQEFMPLYNRIFASAKASLIDQGGQVVDGEKALEAIEDDLVALGRKVREAYIWEVLRLGVAIAASGLVAYLIVCVFAPIVMLSLKDIRASYLANTEWLGPVFLVLPGVALGIVFMALYRNRSLKYEELGVWDDHGFSPQLRFVWITTLSFVVLAVLSFDVVTIGIGGMTLKGYAAGHPAYGILIGLVCGVSDAAIADQLRGVLKPKMSKVRAKKSKATRNTKAKAAAQPLKGSAEGQGNGGQNV